MPPQRPESALPALSRCASGYGPWPCQNHKLYHVSHFPELPSGFAGLFPISIQPLPSTSLEDLFACSSSKGEIHTGWPGGSPVLRRGTPFCPIPAHRPQVSALQPIPAALPCLRGWLGTKQGSESSVLRGQPSDSIPAAVGWGITVLVSCFQQRMWQKQLRCQG